jgi:hypothetical protein
MGAGMERVDPLLVSQVSTFSAEAEGQMLACRFRSKKGKYFATRLRHAVVTPVAPETVAMSARRQLTPSRE